MGNYHRRSGFAEDRDDPRDDFDQGYGRMRGERGAGRGYSGVHAARPDEPIRSRSADPGQSSYGGFTNEDPRRQRQQFGPYPERGGYGGYGYGGFEREPQQRRILPKGYTRSDERLREDICERLSHSGLDVSDVSVEVSQGQVTLEGTVDSRRLKHAIENLADDCLGVQDVDNRIRVQQAGSGKGDLSIGES
ncbi:BON domain-containing protein [Pollutimonas sp. H1-120]|uniref:BON domain-containing protein n=1 Tax=Pollutimonas sp. H1-120 TaxID=3148824 RepID=UPI003B5182FB